jgi:hypothetical protein
MASTLCRVVSVKLHNYSPSLGLGQFGSEILTDKEDSDKLLRLSVRELFG